MIRPLQKREEGKKHAHANKKKGTEKTEQEARKDIHRLAGIEAEQRLHSCECT